MGMIFIGKRPKSRTPHKHLTNSISLKIILFSREYKPPTLPTLLTLVVGTDLGQLSISLPIPHGVKLMNPTIKYEFFKERGKKRRKRKSREKKEERQTE